MLHRDFFNDVNNVSMMLDGLDTYSLGANDDIFNQCFVVIEWDFFHKLLCICYIDMFKMLQHFLQLNIASDGTYKKCARVYVAMIGRSKIIPLKGLTVDKLADFTVTDFFRLFL